MVIDDASIREQSWNSARKILTKIERVEFRLRAFEESDQRLFEDWRRLAFRKEDEEIQAARDEFDRVARFRNQFVALAMQELIPMHEAYRRIKEEDALYADGDDETRARIEQARQARTRFVEDEIRRELGEDHDTQYDEAEESTYSREGDARSDDSQAAFDDDEPIWLSMGEMSDRELRAFCGSERGAIGLVGTALSEASSPEGRAFFLRVWNLLPRRFRKSFARLFEDETGVPLSLVLAEHRRSIGRDRSGAPDEADDEGEGLNDFVRPFGGFSNDRRHDGERAESFGLLYRKLVRRLHPDLQGPDIGSAEADWRKKIWNRAQEAYRREDARELDKLWRLTLLRTGSLSELLISEIRESERWLIGELKDLESQERRGRRSPAWGFSRSRSTTAAERKARKQVDQEMAKIRGRIQELQEQHDALELICQFHASQPQRRKSQSKRRRRATEAHP